MTYQDKLAEQYDLKNWPHRFTKNGPTQQVGEDELTHDGIFVQPMICIDCQAEYLNGRDARPPDPCPARNQKKEMKRLLS